MTRKEKLRFPENFSLEKRNNNKKGKYMVASCEILDNN